MKVLIVFTHPNPSSFNHLLLEKVSTGLSTAGHQIKVKDLYRENFDPTLKSDDLSQIQQGTIPPKVAKEQEQLLWAEGLVFIYPLWWFSPPAMLKGWFDVVLTNGLAFEYSSEGVKGLLKHKRASVIITTGASEKYFKDHDALHLIHRPVTDGTLSFCGIKNVSHEIYYDVTGINDADRSEMLTNIEKMGCNF